MDRIIRNREVLFIIFDEFLTRTRVGLTQHDLQENIRINKVHQCHFSASCCNSTDVLYFVDFAKHPSHANVNRVSGTFFSPLPFSKDSMNSSTFRFEGEDKFCTLRAISWSIMTDAPFDIFDQQIKTPSFIF